MAKQSLQAKPGNSKSVKDSGPVANTGTALPIPTVNAKAMSKDVGLAVIASLASAEDSITQGEQMVALGRKKRYDAQSQLTLAIVKAATNDKSIDLTAAFSEDKKLQNYLNNQIGIALGYRTVMDVPGKKGEQVVSYVKEVYKYFPAPGEDRDTPEYRHKQSTRTNFATRLKQCEMAAASIIADKTKATFDKENGTLRLEGPAVKQQFGVSSVLLNERQTIENKKDNSKIELKEKPSFTAMAARAAEAIGGRPVKRGSNTRGAGAGGFKGKKPADFVLDGAKILVDNIKKLKEEDMTDALKVQLQALVNAINDVL